MKKKNDKPEKPLPPNLRPQAKFPPLMSFHRHPVLWLLKHAFFKRFRRRLVCPSCGAVGTWKPYGYWWKDRNVRRWLCKWCGFYDGVDGRFWCVMDPQFGCWAMPIETEQQSGAEWARRMASGELTTPQKIAERERFNPWTG